MYLFKSIYYYVVTKYLFCGYHGPGHPWSLCLKDHSTAPIVNTGEGNMSACYLVFHPMFRCCSGKDGYPT